MNWLNSIFIFMSIISLSISLKLSHNKDKSLILTPLLLFTVLQIFMVNIGLMLITFDKEQHFFGVGLLVLSTLFLNLGALLIKKKQYIHKHIQIGYQPLSLYNKVIISIGYVLTCILIIFILKDSIFNFKDIVFNMFYGEFINSSSQLADIRRTFSFNSGGNGVITQLKNIVLVYFTIFIISNNFKRYTKIIVIIITLFFLLSSGQRWPLFEALLVYLVFISMKNKIYISVKKIVGLLLLTYSILFIISYVQPRFEMSNDFFVNSLNNIKAINYRLFVSQAMTSYYIFDLIPHKLDYGYGCYIFRDLSTYLPGYQEAFSTMIYKMTHRGHIGSASFSTLTLFFAEFGYFSVIISFIYGMLIQIYTNVLIKEIKSTNRMIFISFVTVAIATTAMGSIVGILSHGLIAGYLLYVLIKILYSINRI